MKKNKLHLNIQFVLNEFSKFENRVQKFYSIFFNSFLSWKLLSFPLYYIVFYSIFYIIFSYIYLRCSLKMILNLLKMIYNIFNFHSYHIMYTYIEM